MSRDFKRQPASDIPWCSSRVATIFHITSLKKRISFLWAANPLGRKTCEMRVTQFCSRNLTPSQIDKEREIERKRVVNGVFCFLFFFWEYEEFAIAKPEEKSLRIPCVCVVGAAFSSLFSFSFLFFSLFSTISSYYLSLKRNKWLFLLFFPGLNISDSFLFFFVGKKL